MSSYKFDCSATDSSVNGEKLKTKTGLAPQSNAAKAEFIVEL